MRITGILLLVSMMMVFTVSAGELTYHQSLSSVDLQYVDGYHHFTAVPGPVYGTPGHPEMPHVGHQVLLPPAEEIVAVRLDNTVWQVIPGQYHLWPAQPPVPYTRTGAQPFTDPASEVYSSDDIYPADNVEVFRTDFMNGHSIGTVTVITTRYQPASGVLEVLTGYDLVIETAPTARAQTAFSTMLKKTPAITQRVARRVANPELMDAYAAPDNTDEVTPKYLIITTETFLDPLELLIDHRTNRGQSVEVELVDDIEVSYSGLDTQDKIRNCVLDYYMNYAIEYVLLCGDVEHVPCRGLYAAIGGEQDNNIPADLYFSNLDGNWNTDGDAYWGEPGEGDLYAEVAIGRFSVDDYAEAYNLIYKTLSYENSPVEADLEHALMVGEDLGWVSWGGEYKDEVRLGSSNYGYTTVGFPANFNVDVLYDMYGTWSAMGDLLPIFNNGLHLGNHLGHSNTTYTMKFNAGQVTAFNMTNNGVNHSYYILYSQGCYGGAFDNRTPGGSYIEDCICEEFTTIQNGAVAFVANSRYGWGSGNNTNGASQYYDRQFFDALFAENITEIGWTNADSKEDCIPYIGGASYWCYYELNILGDPALDIWTAQPMTFSPTYSDTVFLGTSQLDIDVGVAGADVALVFEGEVIGTALANPSGTATVFLDDPLSIPGEATLVITGHNYLPYNGTIAVIAADGPYIMVFNPTFSDATGGNGDGNADLGETLTLGGVFENVGVEDAIGLTATLFIDENCVALNNSVYDLGDLTVGQSLSYPEAFEITLGANVADQQELNFLIVVTDSDENSWTTEYAITAFAPALELVSYTFDDGNDGRLMPGETGTIDLEITNNGHGGTTDLTVSLMTDHPLATINTASFALNPMATGATETIEDLEFTVDATMTDPSALVLYINALDTRLYQDNFLIELPVGGVFDGMETGVGDWTHDIVTPGWYDQWNLSEMVNHTPEGASSWYCGNAGQYMEMLDAGLLTPVYDVYGKHILRFYQWMSAEVASSYPGYCYDGGIVEMSLNGQAFEQITPRGGYPMAFRYGAYPIPLPENTPCYSGQLIWDEAVFDIVGTGTVQFRFRFLSDGATNSIGWFIDDLELIMESTPNAPTDLAATLELNEVTLTWCTPGLGSTSDGAAKPGPRQSDALETYRIYRDGTLIDSVEALTYVDNLGNQGYGSYSYQVSGVFDGEEGSLSEPVSIDYVGVKGDDTAPLPVETTLRSAYPNPFNPVLHINLDLASPDVVRLSVYNLMGQKVTTLIDRSLSAGSHIATWNAAGYASGMYLVKMETGGYTGLQKVLLLK